MQAAPAAYSSVHLRERDKALEEKHRKELAAVERKIEKLKWSNADTLKQLFDVQNRSHRLATSLGFHDVYAAQVAVDTADQDTPYSECFERVEKLQRELEEERAESGRLREQLRLAEDERSLFEDQLGEAQKSNKDAPTSADNPLSRELSRLQDRYDALVDVKDRAAARYKSDYKKWHAFRNWLFDEEVQVNRDKGRAVGEEERKKRELASVLRKRKKLLELGLGGEEDHPSTPHPPLGKTTDAESDKENQDTSLIENRSRRVINTPVSLPPSSTLMASSAVAPTHNARVEMTPTPRPKSLATTAPPPRFAPALTTRMPLPFQPITINNAGTRVKQEPGPSPQPLKRRLSGLLVPSSSDTEDDSQALDPLMSTVPVFKIPIPLAQEPYSSETEDDSQSEPPLPTPRPSAGHPSPPDRYMSPQTDHQRDLDSSAKTKDPERPHKFQRLSGGQAAKAYSYGTPTARRGPDSAGETPRDGAKGNDIQTPANAGGQKRLSDYSAFKGRGRYARDADSVKETLNATYVIDPARNAGLDFQYDEVVRRREDRRAMDAGDCECCRDYYEAVGPLPARLQQPLWKSPPATPRKPCPHHPPNPGHASGSRGPRADPNPNPNPEEDSRQREIDAHKRAISRHRHHWARANTPPGYWNIGFPDTQEAEDINEQAREMHRKKREEVESAVRKGDGRYKKRL